jgi:solute carrier family 25 carnitine/acylcarnitine transporter 20/29
MPTLWIFSFDSKGCLNVFVGHPLDLIKVRQQVAPRMTLPAASTTVGMLRSIFVKEGWMGLYAGMTAPLVAVVPAFACVFYTYDASKTALLTYSNQQHLQHQKQVALTISQTAIAGAISGLPLALVLTPLEKIKCQMQLHPHTSFYKTLKQNQATLFRGTGMTIARDVPGNAAYFCAYEYIRRLDLWNDDTQQSDRHNTALSIVMAGGMAGVCNWTVAIPMDVVKSRFQCGNYASYTHVVTTLLQTEGPRAFFRGLAPALIRAFPSNAACLLGVETVRSLLEAQT